MTEPAFPVLVLSCDISQLKNPSFPVLSSLVLCCLKELDICVISYSKNPHFPVLSSHEDLTFVKLSCLKSSLFPVLSCLKPLDICGLCCVMEPFLPLLVLPRGFSLPKGPYFPVLSSLALSSPPLEHVDYCGLLALGEVSGGKISPLRSLISSLLCIFLLKNNSINSMHCSVFLNIIPNGLKSDTNCVRTSGNNNRDLFTTNTFCTTSSRRDGFNTGFFAGSFFVSEPCVMGNTLPTSFGSAIPSFIPCLIRSILFTSQKLVVTFGLITFFQYC